MKTYTHAKKKHTVTAEDHETTKQAILVRSGWVLVPEVKTEEPAQDESSFVEKVEDFLSGQPEAKTDAEPLAYTEYNKPKATKKQ
jgi:hypothetical protein